MSLPFLIVAAILTSTILTLVMLPLAPRFGLLDRPEKRGGTGSPTPLVGGIPLFCAAWLLPWFWGPTGPLLLLAGAALILAVGLLDDIRGDAFAWQAKLLAQLVCGLLAGIALFPESPMLWLFATCWTTLLMNAVNFQDNMNGLCAGTGIILCLILGVFGRALPWLQASAFCLAGAFVPLLLFNFPRGRLFLGDQGSQLFGYTLALFCLAPGSTTGGLHPAFLAVPALPLLDLLGTLVYRWRRKYPLHRPDQNHFSHRLARCGLGRMRAVLTLWCATALLGLGLPLLLFRIYDK